MTTLASRLPKDHGLREITGDLIDHPDRRHLVLAVVDCKKLVTDMDTGEVEPTARILRIECVRREDYSQAEALIRRALEDRHGSQVLPFDTEEEIRLLFADFKEEETGGLSEFNPDGDS